MVSLAFKKICSYLDEEAKKDIIKIDSFLAHRIVDKLRKVNVIFNGRKIHQWIYCRSLIKSLYDNYISDVDEFVFLYLKVCIACDYNINIITKSLNDTWILETDHFNRINAISLPTHAYNYIEFNIPKKIFHRDRLVTYELFYNKLNKNIPSYGANIPLSDFQILNNGEYKIRICSINLIKYYFKTFYWLPKFYYRFGISSKDNIASGLKEFNSLGRDVNIWCPSLLVRNYKKLHNFSATTSMVMLHDIIHLSILSSYPKQFSFIVYENVKRMTKGFSESERWREPSLAWNLLDFSASHEINSSCEDITTLLSIYIKNSCQKWFTELEKVSSRYEQKKMFYKLFKPMIKLIFNNNLWKIDGKKLIGNLGFDLDIFRELDNSI